MQVTLDSQRQERRVSAAAAEARTVHSIDRSCSPWTRCNSAVVRTYGRRMGKQRRHQLHSHTRTSTTLVVGTTPTALIESPGLCRRGVAYIAYRLVYSHGYMRRYHGWLGDSVGRGLVSARPDEVGGAGRKTGFRRRRAC